MSDEQSQQQSPQPGFKKKNLIIIGLIAAGLWALAIVSGSVVFMSITGVLTLIAIGIAIWAWRRLRQQKDLVSLLQGAADSPEKRQAALAQLAADKKSNDLMNVFARAQLLAAEDPAAALALLEPIDIKTVPPAMQDDVGMLKAQLLLTFGRARDARPIADRINVDSPARQELRPALVAIVAEAWARTGSKQEAKKLLDSVDMNELSGDALPSVLISRVFVQFASGKKGAARQTLAKLASIDINLLGRFVAPQFKVHPGLQRLAREQAQRSPQARQFQQHPGGGGRRRGRPR